MNRLVGWAAAIGVLGATAALVAATPTDMTTSIEVLGEVGQPIHSRLADVTVLDVRLTDRLDVTYDEVDGTTDGVWVVVDAVVTPTLGRLSLGDSILRVGGRTYGASDILGSDDLRIQPYGAGITLQGPLVFELPTSALTGSATIVIEPSGDTRLDSVPAVVVDLAALEILRSIEVGPAFIPEGAP